MLKRADAPMGLLADRRSIRRNDYASEIRGTPKQSALARRQARQATRVVRRELLFKTTLNFGRRAMRYLSLSAIIIFGASGAILSPGMGSAEPGLTGAQATITQIEKVGYLRRQYRRYGYPTPYAYAPPPAYGYYAPPDEYYSYPPAVYGYQAAPPAYAYSPPVYGEEAPPPVVGPSAADDYTDYPPAEGEYPEENSEYQANGY